VIQEIRINELVHLNIDVIPVNAGVIMKIGDSAVVWANTTSSTDKNYKKGRQEPAKGDVPAGMKRVFAALSISLCYPATARFDTTT
jgi:hypothetical protein